MSIVSNSIAQIKRILFTFLGIIRRAFCCRRLLRRHSTSDSILPVTIKPGDNPMPQSSFPQQTTNQLQAYSNSSGQFSQYSQVNNSWQSWDRQNSSFGNPQLVQNVQSACSSNVLDPQTNKHQSDQQEEDEDYFKDMMPTVKKQKKVLLKTQWSPPTESLPSSDKFNFEPNSMAFGNQVSGSWDEDDIEIEDSLREARGAERMRRVAEHQRTKEQKERKKSKSNLTATKLT